MNRKAKVRSVGDVIVLDIYLYVYKYRSRKYFDVVHFPLVIMVG